MEPLIKGRSSSECTGGTRDASLESCALADCTSGPSQSSAVAITRRTFLAGTLAVAAPMIRPPNAAAATAGVFSAHAFFDSIGICTHPCWRNTNWGTTAWEDALISSGVKHTRGDLGHGWGADGGMMHLGKFFSAGGKLCALTTGKTLDRTAAQADLDYLSAKVPTGCLSGIESVNEYNNPQTRPPDWATQLRDFQKWLYGAVRSNQKFSAVPVVAPSIWRGIHTDYVALGNLEPNVNKDCLHYYTGGLRPTLSSIYGGGLQTVQQAISDAHIIAPREALFVTEFGYENPGPGSAQSAWVIPPRAAAKYLVRGLFDLFVNGSERTFIYELMDDPGTNHYWGLCDASLRPKPQFAALKNLVALFTDRYVRLAGLGISIGTTAPADLRRYLFSKSDGSFLLVLYRDIDSYNRSNYTDVDATPLNIIVNLSVSARLLTLYRPTFDSSAQGTATGNSVMVPVDDQVTVLKINP